MDVIRRMRVQQKTLLRSHLHNAKQERPLGLLATVFPMDANNDIVLALIGDDE